MLVVADQLEPEVPAARRRVVLVELDRKAWLVKVHRQWCCAATAKRCRAPTAHAPTGSRDRRHAAEMIAMQVRDGIRRTGERLFCDDPLA